AAAPIIAPPPNVRASSPAAAKNPEPSPLYPLARAPITIELLKPLPVSGSWLATKQQIADKEWGLITNQVKAALAKAAELN
ncbi:MAG: hypothetical protein GY808_17050, partial [Gammaproteobacteria bacterium]|nr:hypothetical protein [Gammaproteobacteria bacterium]